MNIGKKLLIKYEGKVVEGTVIKIYPEDLDIQLIDDTVVRRKFWEVKKIDEKQEETAN